MHFLAEQLAHLQKIGLFRALSSYTPCAATQCKEAEQTYLVLSSNNYLGMTHEKDVQEAAAKAIYRYGAGSGGARLTSGSHLLFRKLEEEIASFKRTEAALVFNTGYMANVGVISALMNQEDDVIFSDALNHASIIDGCRLAKAAIRVFPHNRMEVLEEMLKQTHCRGKRLIVVDGVFSMDGDIAPLDRLVILAEKYDALLMVDDAHATGVLGGGRGTAAHFGLEDRVDIQMGTLSKAIGAEGAYVAGKRALIAYLVNHARSFIFSTALAPATVAASLAAIHLLRQDGGKIKMLLENAQFMREALRRRGIAVKEGITPIIPLLIGEAEKAIAVADALKKQGILLNAIRPPTVPEGQSRLRLTVCADHIREELDKAAEKIARAIAAAKGD